MRRCQLPPLPRLSCAANKRCRWAASEDSLCQVAGEMRVSRRSCCSSATSARTRSAAVPQTRRDPKSTRSARSACTTRASTGLDCDDWSSTAAARAGRHACTVAGGESIFVLGRALALLQLQGACAHGSGRGHDVANPSDHVVSLQLTQPARHETFCAKCNLPMLHRRTQCRSNASAWRPACVSSDAAGCDAWMRTSAATGAASFLVDA